jgi:L-ascorbate metabolism protein UlaG (beta-lactamase superfamily)
MSRGSMRSVSRLWILSFGFLAGCLATPATVASPTTAIAASRAVTPSKEAPRETAAPASISIKKYPQNYACFKIVTSRSVIIITDPFGMTEDVPADIVTVSHDHGDHNDIRHIQPALDPFRTPGEYTVQEIRITGVAGHHNKGDAKTTNVIFVFSMDGIRLAHFASQGEMPTEEMFTVIGTVDILIIQVYGSENGKLTAAEAAEIARRLGAKIVIPAHTDADQTVNLAALLQASNEAIKSGLLTVTSAELSAQQTPRVVTLDNP